MSSEFHNPPGAWVWAVAKCFLYKIYRKYSPTCRFEPQLGVQIPMIQPCRLVQIVSRSCINKFGMSGACHHPRRQGYGLLLGTPYIEYIENRPHPQQVRAPIRDTRPHNTVMPPSADCVP
jgi:hypothetical protein